MVKTRRGDAYGTAAAAVTPAKQARLRRLAAAYLSSVDQGPCRVRFDVVTVTWPHGATGLHGATGPRGAYGLHSATGPPSASPTVEHLEGVGSCWSLRRWLSAFISDAHPELSRSAGMVGDMRSLAVPFVAASPSGARIRTRLRPSAADERVLRAAGAHLGGLAGQDLVVRCRLGGRDAQRAARKRALTAAASSRWAGALTRTSNDQWERGRRNLLEERAGLRRACRVLRARLTVPVGGRCGRVRGYASRAERFCKQGRLRHLEARLAEAEARLAAGRVSVCRGGRRLARLRHALGGDDVALTKAQWRGRWQAARLFLTADGEAGKPLGNETIRMHPDEH